jgi:hypothetical protein
MSKRAKRPEPAEPGKQQGERRPDPDPAIERIPEIEDLPDGFGQRRKRD